MGDIMATPRKKPRAKKSSTPDAKKDSCFVIMPFGGYFNDYYTSIFVPAIEAAGLRSRRADDLYSPSTIVSDIWDNTRKAKLILADLSGKNPNVFYELGLAHAIAKPAILVVESMDDIPFDLRALRILEYDKNDANWGALLQGKIEQAIKEVLAAPHLSVPAAFVEVTPSPPTSTLTVHDRELLQIRQELDHLRRQVRGRPTHFRSRPMPNEVREMIMEFLESGMPERRILQRLMSMDIPESFIKSSIGELIGSSRHTSSLESGENSSADAERVTKTGSTRSSSAKKTVAKKPIKRTAKKEIP